jgi:hypothetical protein
MAHIECESEGNANNNSARLHYNPSEQKPLVVTSKEFKRHPF